MKFSVIVPIYNSEKYIRQCLDSILNQEFSDMEVILVDDGSTDNTARICQNYVKRDCRVRYIQEENSGTSVARNKGLEVARGQYIMFCDNDDYWEGNHILSDISNQLDESQADVLMFKTSTIDMTTGKIASDSRTLKRKDVVGKTAEESLEAILNSGLMAVAVWAKVFKRSMIVEHQIQFPVGKRFEDTDFSAHAFLCAESYDWYEGDFYRYRINTNENQTSHPLTINQLNNLRDILVHYLDAGNALEKKKKDVYASFLAYPYAVWLGYMSASTKYKSRNTELKIMKQYQYVLKCDANSNMRMLSKFYCLFGYNATVALLKVWVRKNRHYSKDNY
jgi:glycosyltransferase involved in cell wall biosynthesis